MKTNPRPAQKPTTSTSKPQSKPTSQAQSKKVEVQKATENITLLKGKYLNLGVKNVKNRTNRDLLMKAFFKWKILCKKPEEYYPKINQGFNILSRYFKKNLCFTIFSKLILSEGSFFNILEIKSLASGSIGNLGGEGQLIFTLIMFFISKDLFWPNL